MPGDAQHVGLDALDSVQCHQHSIDLPKQATHYTNTPPVHFQWDVINNRSLIVRATVMLFGGGQLRPTSQQRNKIQQQ